MSYNERAQTITMLVESFQGIWGGGDKDQEKGLFKLRNPQFSQKKNGLLDVKVLSER